MVRGNIRQPRNEITAKDVLEKTSSYQIYRFYLGAFEIGEAIRNEFRGDKSPSLHVKVICGDLHHFDYASDYWRGRCFDLVMQIYGCDFNEALKRVNVDLNLGIGNGLFLPDKKIITWEESKELKSEPPPLITFSYHTSFSSRQLNYWSKLGVGEMELKKDNIYNPKNIYINHKRVKLPDDLCFIYHYPGDTRMFKGGSVAIYRPEAEKKKKWFKNVTFTYVEHIDKLEGCETGYLAKSKKENLMLRNLLQTDCIATVQAENQSALSHNALNKLQECNTRFFVGDNDKTGTEFSWWLTREYDFKNINVPYNIPMKSKPGTVTDIADWAHEYDYKTVEEYFIRKGLKN